MVEISEDLRDLVASTISSIKEGLKEEKCGVSGTIKFEVSVVKSREGKTGFNVVVADASGKYTKDNLSKISFEIAGILSESEKADLQNQISQLAEKLNASNSKVAQLTKQIGTQSNTIEEQKATIKEKSENSAELRKEINQLNTKVTNAKRERDQARSERDELSHRYKGLQDELSEKQKVG
jgi:predicted  nucleic acid-binding Zn-ribbon protein